MADTSFFGSPKRKRDLTDNLGRAASPLRVKMDLDQRASEGPPECHISHELQELHIQQSQESMQRLTFREKATSPSGSHAPMQASRTTDTMEEGAPPSSSSLPTPTPTQPTSQASSTPSQLHLAPPRTPPLNPIALSPYDTPRTISPLPSLSDVSGAARPDAALRDARLATPPLSSTDTTPTRQRNRSPPPIALTSDLVWTAEEITGHTPDDPNDDGYGINGIGFRPTSAVAQQRALRRRQQVAEWKTREARDARNRRAERRRSAGFSGRALDRDRRHVRFVES